MALVPCRECGKEVSDQAPACPYCGIKTPSKKKRRIKLAITALIILMIVGGCAWAYHRVSQIFAPPVTMDAAGKPVVAPVSKIQKNIPVKEQVIQKSSKEIIYEMLDSGETIGYISKKTGIRRDEIRKMKKEREDKEKK